jgi:hypothetical protein
MAAYRSWQKALARAALISKREEETQWLTITIEKTTKEKKHSLSI